MARFPDDLPNFLIIGAQKAATTWLATCLDEHPEVFIPPGKELYFFNNYYDRGLGWYRAQFSGRQDETAAGEATPGYLSHPEAAKRIRQSLSKVKLIVSLRHPVDRAYSAFWHYVSRGRISEREGFLSWFERDSRYELRSRGCYGAHLERYLAEFSRSDLLALIYEETSESPQRAIEQCLDFLELSRPFVPEALKARVNVGRAADPLTHRAWRIRRALRFLPSRLERFLVGAGIRVLPRLSRGDRAYESLSPSLRQRLLERYYLEDIQQLEQLLGRDLAVWYGTNSQLMAE